VVSLKDHFHEPCLPCLPMLLDAARMREALIPRVYNDAAESDLSTISCAIERIKYQPGKNCLVVYRLSAPAGETRVACRTYEAGGSHSRFAKARRVATEALTGTRVIHLADLDSVGWVFPHDRKLDHLARLMDLSRLEREVIPSLAQAIAPGRSTGYEVAHSLVHYVPEHTASVRLTLRWGEARAEVYGKTYYDATGASTWHHMQQIYPLLGGQMEVQIARALRYESATRTLWQAAVPGGCLPPANDLAISTLQHLGQALARFHMLPLDLPNTSFSDLDTRIELAVRQISHALPRCAQQLTDLGRALSRLLPDSFAETPLALLHGDLHPGNILVAGPAYYLIDLDNLTRGPAVLDLGSWVASELYRALLDHRGTRTVIDAAEHLLDAYCSTRGCAISPRALWIATAYALVSERARRCVTRLKAGRLALVDELLALASLLLSRETP
jgi:Phosphotransferase enzyme family